MQRFLRAQPLALEVLLALVIALPAGAGSKSLTIADTHSQSGSGATALSVTAPSVSGGVLAWGCYFGADAGPCTVPTASAPLQYDHWQSPTGRIRCDYRNQVGVGCVQLDRGWGIFLRSFGRANYGYPYSQPGPGRTLSYGQTLRISTFRCLSQFIGMKCWSTLTGNGFFISRTSRSRTAVRAVTPRAVAVRRSLIVVIVGAGRVTSKPAGISCPRKCAATFSAGTRVVLTARAKNGFRLRRWGGACRGAGACSVRMTSPRAVTAQFARGRKTPPPPPRQKSVVEPGSYLGTNPQSNLCCTKLFVSAGGTSMTNISVPVVYIACTPAGRFPTRDHLGILQAAIKPDGSFTARASQDGVFAGVKAKFTYSFTGHFQGANAAGAATAAGSFREDIVFTDSTTHRCTSNDQSWTATRTRDPQPPKRSVVEPGSYLGTNPQSNLCCTKFSVSAGGTSMTNISVPVVYIACTPAGRFPTRDHLGILQAAIKPDGSFTAKASQDGVFAGTNAKFTYSFTGYFQGVNAAGAATASGLFREDIVFMSGSTTHTCTSNEQSWTATRSS